MHTKIAATFAILLSAQVCFGQPEQVPDNKEDQTNAEIDKRFQQAVDKITYDQLKSNPDIQSYKLPIENSLIKEKVQLRISNPSAGPPYFTEEVAEGLKKDSDLISAWANCEMDRLKAQFYEAIADKVKALIAANPHAVGPDVVKKNEEFLAERSRKAESCPQNITAYQTYVVEQDEPDSYSRWQSTH